MKWNIKSMGVYNAITVSTDNLKDFYSKYRNPEYIYVCPNSLDMMERDKVNGMDFSKSELYKKQPGEIRIIWSGSASHWENLKFIEKPVIEILKKYPNVTFYYTGLFGDLFQDKEVRNRIKTVGFCDLRDYGKILKEHKADFALAPLTDNDFNRAKSNLRVLEYGSVKIPSIVSPIVPYRCFNATEVIFAKEREEWFKAMEDMINSKNMRDEYAESIYKRVKKDFNIDKNYKLWTKAFKNIIHNKPELL
jgi:glycosyltransferase involved in cell wall biosynthesis